jgi:hypothetical protein
MTNIHLLNGKTRCPPWADFDLSDQKGHIVVSMSVRDRLHVLFCFQFSVQFACKSDGFRFSVWHENRASKHLILLPPISCPILRSNSLSRPVKGFLKFGAHLTKGGGFPISRRNSRGGYPFFEFEEIHFLRKWNGIFWPLLCYKSSKTPKPCLNHLFRAVLTDFKPFFALFPVLGLIFADFGSFLHSLRLQGKLG